MKVFLLIAFVFMGPLVASTDNYQTHTLYINSFARMIQWPDEYNRGNFEIFVLGESPIFAELQKMAEKKKIVDRAYKVFKITSLQEFSKGHMLFIAMGQSGQLGETLAKVGDKSTLVITEQAGLGAKGSDINFITKDGRLAFELNPEALAKHRLKASSQLTKLAIII
jgi:hypothetical protein